MGKLSLLLLVAVVAAAVVGCRSVSPPNWFHPGPAANQQSRAERYDPYPESEPAPEIIGGRPREYQKALPEPSRARWMPWGWGRR